MDKQFLEIWGNIMLSAAKGQQQLEDLMGWMAGSTKDLKEMYANFCRMYGMDPGAGQPPDYVALWKKTFNEFKDTYGELVAMMDLVPRRDCLALARENEDLKKRIAELEDAVRHFRSLLEEQVTAPADGIRGFRELIDDQARQYQEFMKGVTSVFGTRSTAAGSRPTADATGKRGSEKGRPKTKPAGKAGSAGGKK